MYKVDGKVDVVVYRVYILFCISKLLVKKRCRICYYILKGVQVLYEGSNNKKKRKKREEECFWYFNN